RDQAGATDVILDIKRLLLSPGNTSISPENIAGQSLSVGFRPFPQTTPNRREHKKYWGSVSYAAIAGPFPSL
ncbi:hypothetical protein FKK47_28660, partial [Klebsiella pneumoniae]|nr:hypothetical protein [Klebsiella pneumoniae]